MYEGSDLKRWFDTGALGIVLIGLAVVAVIAAIVVGVVLIVRAGSKRSGAVGALLKGRSFKNESLSPAASPPKSGCQHGGPGRQRGAEGRTSGLGRVRSGRE